MELGQLFVDEGLITAEQLATARESQSDERIDQSLIHLGMISEDQVLKTFSAEFSIPYVDLNTITVDKELLTELVKFSTHFCHHR